jgi:CRP/FNR family cyclic AMP-dependent transcriptional regulator
MSVVNILKEADIFDDLSLAQLELVASICTERHYHIGDMIFEENTVGDELYVIASGEVQIMVNPALVGRDIESGLYAIATLRRGQSFGEIALVDEGIRSAGAFCSNSNTHLVVIPRERLMALCDAQTELGYRLMRNLAADLAMKIRQADLQIREQLTWSHGDK